MLIYTVALFLEVWSGEGDLHVRLEGEAKINYPSSAGDSDYLLNVLFSLAHHLVLSLTSWPRLDPFLDEVEA